MASVSKYLAHSEQYFSPNAYGLGEGKQGYANFSQTFLHGGIYIHRQSQKGLL
jgi:hypothetical protein